MIGISNVTYYNTGNKIQFLKPDCLIQGTVWGSRIINFEGKASFFDLKNLLYCEFVLNPEKKGWF